MSKATKTATKEEHQAEQAASFQEIVGKNLLARIGRPEHLHEVQVRQVRDMSYRINVLVKLPASLETMVIPMVTTVASYYVTVNEDGAIVTSNPPLVAPIRVKIAN